MRLLPPDLRGTRAIDSGPRRCDTSTSPGMGGRAARRSLRQRRPVSLWRSSPLVVATMFRRHMGLRPPDQLLRPRACGSSGTEEPPRTGAAVGVSPRATPLSREDPLHQPAHNSGPAGRRAARPRARPAQRDGLPPVTISLNTGIGPGERRRRNRPGTRRRGAASAIRIERFPLCLRRFRPPTHRQPRTR